MSQRRESASRTEWEPFYGAAICRDPDCRGSQEDPVIVQGKIAQGVLDILCDRCNGLLYPFSNRMDSPVALSRGFRGKTRRLYAKVRGDSGMLHLNNG